MFSSIAKSASPFMTTSSHTCAISLGFQSINGKSPEATRAVKDNILPTVIAKYTGQAVPTSAERIRLLQEFGGWDAEGQAFPAGFNINEPIRIQGGTEYRWLDLAHETTEDDNGFARFLLENGANLTLCRRETGDALQELADNVGFQAINGKTAEETKTVRDEINAADSEEKIRLLQDFGEWNAANQAFPRFDINAPIRIQGGTEYRWLDVAAELRDNGFANFLLENGASLDNCIETTKDTLRELADNVGFQAINGKTAEETKRARDTIIDPDVDTAAKIATLKTFGAWDEASSAFPPIFDINQPIRIQNGVETRWLDLAADIQDQNLAHFLLKNGARHDQCRPTTPARLDIAIALYNLERSVDTTQTNRPHQYRILPGFNGRISNNAGRQIDPNMLDANVAAARGCSLGSDICRLVNPICLTAVIAGGSLYATSIAFNGLISSGYLAAQGFASIAVLPTYAADKAISGGINLVRTGLGYDKMDTRYYLTKTFGGAACLTGLLAVAICTNNPGSIVLRTLLISGPAYLGTRLISWGLEGGQPDATRYNESVAGLDAYFESTQPDMQLESWSRMNTFIYNLATKRGFKDNYKNSFTVPTSNTDLTPSPNPEYPGIIRGTIASFAMRIYP